MGKGHFKPLNLIIENDNVLKEGDWLNYQTSQGLWVDTLVFPRMRNKEAKVLFDSIAQKF
jgi:hypothetical protein